MGVAAVVGVCLVVRSRNYNRFKRACEDIPPGTSLGDAREILEDASGRHAAKIVRPDGVEHQWIRVRFSLKHQNCAVVVDNAERVVSVRHSDVWDLL